MCFSPCFVHATSEAFVQRRLLACRTCGSQAFHALDCCRNPDYMPVQNSPLRRMLASWMARLQERLRPWWSQAGQHTKASTTIEALDGWEARPFKPIAVTITKPLRDLEPEATAEADIYETTAAQR